MQIDIPVNIDIQKVKTSRVTQVDFNKLQFGQIFTDHMFVCDYKDGKWQTPKIMPYEPLRLDPSAKVFHYGQAVFEGMKGYKDRQGQVWLFRPEENWIRINKSAHRLCMPEFPKAYFFEGLKTLLRMENEWIPGEPGSSLYIRPFVIATEPEISATPSKEYKFMIICSPAQKYYEGEVWVQIAEKYSRAASGGVGFAKAAGNYASQFHPTKLSNEIGYQQIIWTDANTHEYLEEAGTMNIFFRIGDKLITAPTNDRILDGITRKSVIAIAREDGIEVDERPITVDEIVKAVENNLLKEIFGTGTAAVITPVKGFAYKNKKYELPSLENSYASLIKAKLIEIQYNMGEDKFGWRYKIA